jgi:Domain of unknown function (DUF4956)
MPLFSPDGAVQVSDSLGQALLNRSFFVSVAIDLMCMFILTRGIYFRHYRRSDLFLTYFSFNLVIFLLAYSLNRVELTMGAAFGLFAVFSMLRYRTENISARDMTYTLSVRLFCFRRWHWKATGRFAGKFRRTCGTIALNWWRRHRGMLFLPICAPVRVSIFTGWTCSRWTFCGMRRG